MKLHCPNFRQIKTFGDALSYPARTPLRRLKDSLCDEFVRDTRRFNS